MYDALLDSLEDEPISRADETLDLGEDPVGVIDVEEDDLDRAVLDDDEEHDPELDLAAEDLLAGVEDESWSDDPVRMYLTQMGEIPLLTRQEEVALAKQIEVTRTRFRHKVLECDYVMQTAVKVLRRVHDGDLPFDRTVQVSVTDQLEKHQILGRLAAQSAHAGDAVEAESARLQHRHEQVARHGASGGRRGASLDAAAAARCGWSKNSACARSGSSR